MPQWDPIINNKPSLECYQQNKKVIKHFWGEGGRGELKMS